MPSEIMIDSLHVSVFAPRGLRDEQYDAIAHALDSKRFRTEFSGAIRKIFRRFAQLRNARVTITR